MKSPAKLMKFRKRAVRLSWSHPGYFQSPGIPTVHGVIYLKDIVKAVLADRLPGFRAMGIRTVMITGGQPSDARAIAREARGRFLAEAKPEDKLAWIRKEQAGGRLVAMD